MPSSHTASVVGLTTALGLSEGTSSTLFALAVVLSLVVAYDATGVRLHAGELGWRSGERLTHNTLPPTLTADERLCLHTPGRHAAALNTIIGQLPREHPAADVQQLQETLGHTPPQVAAGAAVGVLTAALFIGALRLVAG
jgi:acid phosphatase family membrane protein YuiD